MQPSHWINRLAATGFSPLISLSSHDSHVLFAVSPSPRWNAAVWHNTAMKAYLFCRRHNWQDCTVSDGFLLFYSLCVRSNQTKRNRFLYSPLQALMFSPEPPRISDFFRWQLMAVYWCSAYKMSITGKALPFLWCFLASPTRLFNISHGRFLFFLLAKDKKQSNRGTSRCTINGIS